MYKWSWRQNNGNHPIRTVDRKTNKKKRKESNIGDLRDDIKYANIHIIGVPEEEREKWVKNVFEEIMAENFPNLK